MKMYELTALELGAKIKSGEVTVAKAIESVFERIQATDKKLNCYVTLEKEKALTRAAKVQKQIDDGTLTSPLAGVPISLKDNICTKGTKMTASSKMLSNFVPTYNAKVSENLEKAGMIVIGKLNLDEFAMGSTTETSFFGASKNPWDTAKVPGGSSGGAAAAVAADSAFIALGTDTGGSIRQPSSFCGVTGLKPTYGTVSRWGVVAFASSFDQVGPIGKNAVDCAALFDVIRGKDENDATSVERTQFSTKNVLNGEIRGKKFALPKQFLAKGIDKDVKDSILQAVDTIREQGGVVDEVDLPILKYVVPTYYILTCAEASSNLARFDGVRYGHRSDDFNSLDELYTKSRSEGFGTEVKRRLLLGNFVLSSGYFDAYYTKATKARRIIQDAVFALLDEYDSILGPVSPSTAYKIGTSTKDPLEMYLADIYTAMVNLAGVPAVSTPCGFDTSGMPVGLQIIGRPFAEETILGIAHAFEKVNAAAKKKPEIQ